MRATIQPVSLATANALVRALHRHSHPVVGHLFSLGAFDADWTLLGAAIVGRPVARLLDDGQTVEVTRLVTDGTRNLCSQLYSACRREARRRGYVRLVTYIRADETGASLKASGWHQVATVTARQWNCPSRPRAAREAVARTRWEVTA